MQKTKYTLLTGSLLIMLSLTGCSSPEILWTFGISDYIVDTPAVAQGRVFFGGLDGYLYAVDARDGKLVWKFRAEQKIFSPAAVEQDAVYFGDGEGHFYALDALTGTQLWRTKMEGDILSQSATVAVEGRVYLETIGDLPAAMSTVHELDAKTGKEVWQRGGTRPSIASGTLYMGGTDADLYAIDLRSHNEKWSYRTHDRVTSPVAMSSSNVYFGDALGYVYAVDAQTGLGKWQFITHGSLLSTPAIAAGVAYIGCTDNSLYALDATTGQERWRFAAKAQFNGPVVDDGTVYAASYDGHLYAIDAETGRQKWAVNTQLYLTPSLTIEPFAIRSSPILADNVIYFGSDDRNLYAVRVQ